MKIAIIGGRDFNDYKKIESTVGWFIDNIVDPNAKVTIVSGGAYGADSLGEYFAKQHKFPTQIFKPDWQKHGKAAGFIRNTSIIEAADTIFAFWDGKSKGTEDSINKAKKLNKTLYIIRY